MDIKDVREVLVRVSGSGVARGSSIGNAAGFGRTAVLTDPNGAQSQSQVESESKAQGRGRQAPWEEQL